MTEYILPCIILFVFIYGISKKTNCYASFTTGAKKSLQLIIDIFPFIICIMIMIGLFRASNLSFYLAKTISPIFSILGIPTELCELIFLKPFSGSGSLALLGNIYEMYGVDSYIARCASVIMGSSDTVFYISTVYFSKTKVKRLGYAIPVSLLATIIGAIISCLICKII